MKKPDRPKQIIKKDSKGDVAVIRAENAKAFTDALAYQIPFAEYNVALDEETIIPLQACLLTSDKQQIILCSMPVAEKLVSTGKAKWMFKAMTDQEKIEKIGY